MPRISREGADTQLTWAIEPPLIYIFFNFFGMVILPINRQSGRSIIAGGGRLSALSGHGRYDIK